MKSQRYHVRDTRNRTVRECASLQAAIVHAKIWGCFARIWDNQEQQWVRW